MMASADEELMPEKRKRASSDSEDVAVSFDDVHDSIPNSTSSPTTVVHEEKEAENDDEEEVSSSSSSANEDESCSSSCKDEKGPAKKQRVLPSPGAHPAGHPVTEAMERELTRLRHEPYTPTPRYPGVTLFPSPPARGYPPFTAEDLESPISYQATNPDSETPASASSLRSPVEDKETSSDEEKPATPRPGLR